MSMNVNDKNIGHATAYAYYKAGGGTMTEAEFTEFMADFGTASQTAVEAAQAALASKNAAQTAATTATNKASEATTAATTATAKAGEASTSASTATSAKDTAVSASQTATTKASEATTAAATAVSAKDDAVSANTAAQSAKTAAQTAQTGAETAAASVQSSAAQIQTNADDISELKEELTYGLSSLGNEATNISLIWENGQIRNGADSPGSNHRRTIGYINVYDWTTLAITNTAFNPTLYIVEYDANKTYIKQTSHTRGTFNPTSENCKYVRLFTYSPTVAPAEQDQYISAQYHTTDETAEQISAINDEIDEKALIVTNLLDANVKFISELFEIGATINNQSGNTTYIFNDVAEFDINSTDIVGIKCDNIENSLQTSPVTVYQYDISGTVITTNQYRTNEVIEGLVIVPQSNAKKVKVRLYPSISGGLTDTTAKFHNVRIYTSSDGRFAIKADSGSNPYAVPAYYLKGSYLDNKIDTIEGLMANANGNYDAFFFCTDQHWLLNAHNSPKLIHHICDRLNIPRMFMGGDYADGINLNALKAFRDAFGGKIYNTIGNHEYMNYMTAIGSTDLVSKNINGADIWAYINMGMTDAVIGDFARNYYYVDNPVQKMRYIILSVYTDNGGSVVTQFETAQQTWLQNVALNLPSGYTAIIFAHHMYNVYYDNDTITLDAFAQPIIDIVDGYSGNGEIACIIHGHAHVDGMTATSNGIPVFITTCDKYAPWMSGNTNNEPWLTENRHLGTITEQAFDVVVIDKTNKLISFVRIGAPADNGTSDKLELRQQNY